MAALETWTMSCPECRDRRPTSPSKARIGNQRSTCATCNNFAQNVMRLTRKRLMQAHPEEYATIRESVEKDLYPLVCEQWIAKHGAA